MADTVDILTRKLTREKLSRFLPNHEAIKAFEAMQQDIADTIPVAVQTALEAAEAAEVAAQSAQVSAQSALLAAASAQAAVDALALLLNESGIDALQAQIGALIAENAMLRARISSLQEGPP
jgi:hypothetical protein